jgi:hypothetical protein
MMLANSSKNGGDAWRVPGQAALSPLPAPERGYAGGGAASERRLPRGVAAMKATGTKAEAKPTDCVLTRSNADLKSM